MTRRPTIAPFRFDVTPPLGHALCGGWIKPVVGWDDPLEGIGFVLAGAGAPVVICAIDWLGIGNEAHLAWRTALAEAARTTADRVAVHCVHQHNAPYVCLDAARWVAAQPDLRPILDLEFHRGCLERARAAVGTALTRARRVTHVARGEARVERVASNRRVARDARGQVTAMRRSRCADPALVGLPEGIVDPMLKTVAFFDDETKTVACHYYATHPMSYYEDGRVSSDFCGLARKRRQQAEPGCTHLYFTGCAGNIAAGKYNDGSPAARLALTERMEAALAAAEAGLRVEPLRRVEWRTREIWPKPNPLMPPAALERALADRSGTLLQRLPPAFRLAWLRRCGRGQPIILSALHLEDISVLHLPGEVFVEFQLEFQRIAPGRFLATAGYGDAGPSYIPTKEEYACGGYEVDHAFCDENIGALLTDGVRELLN